MVFDIGHRYVHVMWSLFEARFTEHRDLVVPLEWSTSVARVVEVANMLAIDRKVAFCVDRNPFPLKVEESEEDIHSRP